MSEAPAESLPRPVSGILTHTRPDLDAILSVWLLRRLGEDRYPGAASCPLIFVPAGELPEGLNPEQWEERGWLAVDVGGGRLDNHPRPDLGHDGRRDACASTLVAQDLGVEGLPELAKLLRFSAAQDLEGRSIASKDPTDHAVALPNILRGLVLVHDDAEVMRIGLAILDGIVAVEREWAQAVREVKKARAHQVAGARVLAVEGESQALGRAARRRGADLVVQRHRPTGQAAVTLNRAGVLRDWDLSRTAPYLRLAEAAAEDRAPAISDLPRIGLFEGWFLHGSGKILNKGSPKAPQVRPSRLSLAEMADWVEASLDPGQSLPEPLCPREPCRGPSCPAHAAALPNCAGHRLRMVKPEAGDEEAYRRAREELRVRTDATRAARQAQGRPVPPPAEETPSPP